MADLIRVLYVDDEPYLLDIGKIFLEKLGDFSVTTIDSAASAFELISKEKFDAIISDYQMPEMDGITFLKRLKESGNNTPFIIFTGRGREEVAIDALNNGADFYIQKGGEPKAQFTELVHKIRSAVNRLRTEKLAKDAERRLYDIINFLPDATFAIDNNGQVIAWNKAIEEMTGISARDILDKGNYEYSIPFYGERRPTLIDLVSIPDEELINKWYSIIKKEGDILIAETKLPRPLGRHSVLLGKASRLYNSEGIVIGAIESIRDITEQKQTQYELRKAHDEYIDLLEHMTDVYYRSDMQGRLILASRSWAKVLGYGDLSLCLGKNIADTFYLEPTDRKKLLEELYRKGFVSDYEIVLKKRDGTQLPIATSSYFYFDESGNVLGVEGTWRDITERKQMEEELRFSERKFAAAFDASPDPIAITDIQTGTILDVNHAFEEWSGYSREEMNGKSTQDLNLWLFPEERDAFIRALNSQGSVSKKEVTFRTKSGNLRNMLLFANVFGIGENNYMLSVAEDITGKKQAEEKLRINLEELIQQEIALRETKRELADIIEFLPDATFVINRDGIVIAWNHAMEEMTGITKEEMIGKGDHAYTLPFYGHRRMQLLDLIDLDDHELKSKYKYVTKKGNTLYAEVFSPALYGGKGAYVWATGSPLFDLNGNRIGAIESIRDITERNRVEEALRQANKKLTLLSNITRHDINNKLTVINGILDLLESEQSDPVLCEYLFKVSTASKRISDMIRFTKEYEQIGVNAPSWQKCRTLVDSALKEAMPGQIIVKNDLPNGAEIYSDLLIGKVFYNLIDNALRYGGKITFIRFFVQRSDNLCIIVCEDDGEGVPIEDKMEIFERGFGKNSGLGLTLAREILEMTGITLRETGEPGRGARFEMAVPAANWRENPDF